MKNIYQQVKRIVAGAALLAPVALQAQDQQNVSLYIHQPSIINPAAMGSFDQINGALLFNKQLSGFDGSPMTGFLDFGMPIGKSNAYVGFQANVDRIGATTKTMVGGSFAYRIRLNMKHYLSLGLNLSANMTSGNMASVPIQDPNDPVFAKNTEIAWSPDIRLGAYYFSDNVFAGFSIGNIFTNSLFYADTTTGGTSDIRVNGEDMHFYITGGWQKKFGKNWKIRPSALIRYVPGSPLQFDINANAVFRNAFGFGVTYRTTSTLIANVSYTLNDYLVFAYAFNIGLNYRESANYTGHEIMLAFRIKNPKRIVPVEVPRF